MVADGDQAEGMGAHPSGPSFDAPVSGSSETSHPVTGATGQSRETRASDVRDPLQARDFRPPARRLPAVLTVIAVLLVGGVVAVASITSSRQDATRTAPSSAARPVTARPAPSTMPTNEISFSTPYGDGVLTVSGHTWSSGTGRAPSRAFLTVRVRIRAVAGEIDVDPTYFQVLDQAGAVYDSIPAVGGQRELQTTTLSTGESVAGGVTFNAPRGDVTLLMGDGAQGMTAIRVPA